MAFPRQAVIGASRVGKIEIRLISYEPEKDWPKTAKVYLELGMSDGTSRVSEVEMADHFASSVSSVMVQLSDLLDAARTKANNEALSQQIPIDDPGTGIPSN